MKIPLATGKEVDTDKLNDKDAAIHEAISNLYSVCEKFNVTGFARISVNDKDGLGMLYLPSQTEEIKNKSYFRLINSISDWLEKVSLGRLTIIDTQEDTDSPQDEEDGKGLE